MKAAYALIAGAIVLLGPMLATMAQVEGPLTGSYRVKLCLITPLHEPLISATKAGRLLEVPKDGQLLQEGDLLAQIDDQESLLSVQVAQYEYENAAYQAQNDVDIRYAQKQTAVTGEEVRVAIEANALQPKAFSDSEVRQRKFTHERSKLAEEQAKRDHVVAQTTAKAAQAKMEAAKLDVEMRKIRSPLVGVASEVLRQRGEWVNPGDPIVKMLGLSRLKFEGFVDVNKWRPREVNGKPVTVEVKLSGDEVKQLQGTITYVSYDVGANDEFRVWAEIDNPELPGGGYLVSPGMSAEMVIHMR